MGIEVSVIGDINVDMLTHPMKSLPEADRQVIIPRIFMSAGGSACNTAIACARLGLETRLIGKLGNDIFSSFLLNSVKNAGVDSKIKISKEENTGITFALSVKDLRSFITYKGTNDTLSIHDFSLKDIGGKFLVICGFNLLNGLRKDVRNIFSYARDRGMETFLDPNWDPDGWTQGRMVDLYRVLKVTDWFFPDMEEGRAMTKISDKGLVAKKLIAHGAKNVCLKLGKNGCLVATSTTAEHIKSFRIKPLNTTGAGDVFLAAFIKEYSSGSSIEDSGLFANAAAALSTTRFGPDRYPAYDEVKGFMETRGI